MLKNFEEEKKLKN